MLPHPHLIQYTTKEPSKGFVRDCNLQWVKTKNWIIVKSILRKLPGKKHLQKKFYKEGAFLEPVEMTILPSLDILIAQRRGEILLYKKKDNSLTKAGFLNVYHTTHTPDAMAEEGLMGIQQDPGFIENHFIYVFYSPVDTSVNGLCRFTYIDDKVDPKSEKVII